MIGIWTRNRDRVNEAIDDFFLRLGHRLYELFCDAGRGCIFFWESIKLAFRPPLRFEEIVKHMEFIGNKSVLIIALTSVFTGLALSYQIYLGFALVNATNLVGPIVGMGITRELGPVLTGLLV